MNPSGTVNIRDSSDKIKVVNKDWRQTTLISCEASQLKKIESREILTILPAP